MNAVKSWTMTICLISIICTIAEILLPSGKMEKILKVVLGVFMLSSLLVSFKNTFANINFNAKKPENFIKEEGKLKDTMDTQTKIAAQKNLKLAVEKFLKKINVKPQKIDVFMDTDEKNCISIKKIQVYLLRSDASKKDVVKNELEKKLELKIEVVVGSE